MSTKILVPGLLLVAAAAALSVRAAPPKEPAPPGFALHGDVAAGKKVFLANCASCHGTGGHGNGVAGMALKPPPASFADVKRFGGISDWELYNAVKDGGGAVHLSPAMPAFAATLTDPQIKDVLTYVKETFIEPALKASDAQGKSR